jgi:hypothetical protein
VTLEPRAIGLWDRCSLEAEATTLLPRTTGPGENSGDRPVVTTLTKLLFSSAPAVVTMEFPRIGPFGLESFGNLTVLAMPPEAPRKTPQVALNIEFDGNCGGAVAAN